MSLRSEVEKLVQDHEELAYLPVANYNLAGSPYTLWTITGGAIEIKRLVCTLGAAIVAATTVDVAVNAVPCNVALPVIGAGATGDIVVWPMDVLGVAAPLPAESLTALSLRVGMIAGLSGGAIITATILGVAGAIDLEWACIYKRLSPVSQLV